MISAQEIPIEVLISSGPEEAEEAITDHETAARMARLEERAQEAWRGSLEEVRRMTKAVADDVRLRLSSAPSNGQALHLAGVLQALGSALHALDHEVGRAKDLAAHEGQRAATAERIAKQAQDLTDLARRSGRSPIEEAVAAAAESPPSHAGTFPIIPPSEKP